MTHHANDHTATIGSSFLRVCFDTNLAKMSRTSHMCSTTITRITLKIMCTASGELAVPVPSAQPSRFSQLTVSRPFLLSMLALTKFSDSKQARDLIAILQESKQQIDPRLSEMARYGGGGGGGGRGWRGGRGGRGGYGGHGGGFTGSNSAPIGNRRW